MKKIEHKSIDNTFGDVRYRFSYDDSRRAAAVRIIRRSKRGPRSFWLTVCVVGAFCLFSAGVAVLYRSIDNDKAFSGDVRDYSADDVIPVNSHVVTGGCKSYAGRFTVSDMTDRVAEVYHIPDGIIVSDIRDNGDEKKEDMLNDGDVITAIDGISTPDVSTFDDVFSLEKESFTISVFREGRHVTINYVNSDEE